MNKYQLPVASWVESFTDWLTSTFAGLFSFLQTIGQSVIKHYCLTNSRTTTCADCAINDCCFLYF